MVPPRYDRGPVDELKGRDFLRVSDWSREELLAVLDLADRLKAGQTDQRLLPGRTLGMIFQKPSTRTRVSFEVGIAHLGGVGLYLAAGDLQLGRGEPIRDTAIVLSRYLDSIMIRTFAQADVEELAEHADVPVINGLTDATHPCQALADAMTIREQLGRFEGVRVAYVGDGNNVLHSLAAICNRLGMSIVAATPAGYEPDPAEGERRLRDLAGYAIDSALLGEAADGAIVLHCLPAHVGEEIDEGVLYGPRSAVWDQAENRLHAQKALLALVVP